MNKNENKNRVKEHPGFQKGHMGYWLGKKRPNMKNVKGFNRTGISPWNKNKILPQISGEKHPGWKGKNNKVHICDFCKNQFETERYNNQRFCSKKCKCDWMSKEKIVKGENNGMWNNGSSLIRHTWEFKEKISPMLRNKYPCLVCFTKEDLVVHHCDLNKNNNKISNMLVLCRIHHAQMHKTISEVYNEM